MAPPRRTPNRRGGQSVVRSRPGGHWYTEDRAAPRWHTCHDVTIPRADDLAGAVEPLNPDRDTPGWYLPDVAHVAANRPPSLSHSTNTPRRTQITHHLGSRHAAQPQHKPSCEQLREKIGAHPVASFPALKALGVLETARWSPRSPTSRSSAPSEQLTPQRRDWRGTGLGSWRRIRSPPRRRTGIKSNRWPPRPAPSRRGGQTGIR